MKKLILLCLGVSALGACKKDSEPAPATISRTNLLTAKNWRMTAKTASITVAGITIPDNTIDACEQDDFLKFNTNKTLVSDEGTNKCNPSDSQTETGTWDLKTNDTQLDVSLPSSSIGSGTIDIKELSATTLRLYSSATSSGITYTVDVTFTAF